MNPTPLEIDNIKKILLIQTAFIGDVVLTTPLIKEIKSLFRNSTLDVLVNLPAENILKNNKSINNLIVYDKRGKHKGLASLLNLGKRLRQSKYNLVISPHRSFRSALLSKATGAKIRIGFDISTGSLFYTHKVPYLKNSHEIKRNLSLLKPFGSTVKLCRPEVFPSANDIHFVKTFFYNNHIDLNNSTVAIAPGSVWATKRWPKEYYADLTDKLISNGLKVALIGGKADKELCESISMGFGKTVLNVAGIFNLLQSAYLIRKCRALVTNDSAPLHLGVAVDTPVVAIFGSTVPAFGFAPLGDKHRVIEYSLNCRPCGIHGHQKCPIGTLDCMKKISPEQVYQQVKEILREKYETAP